MPNKSTEFARELRKNSTLAERVLWKYLRNRQITGHKFRRQYPIDHYIVDFLCLEKQLIVEIDGGQHARQVEDDTRRSEHLKSKGYRIIRFWNNEVLQNITGVLEVILRELEV
jgi:very-short-patch-repair endonuclease